MKANFDNYDKGEFLGVGEDMAHHKYDAYKVDDEIHIVYESGYAATVKIQDVKNDMDKYLWTPYVEWVYK
ncbi:MAG: hypothetical protein PF437_08015 [Sulfurimonas sp.]|nr:hypothetical protein [Sulfurimonas sp.]